MNIFCKGRYISNVRRISTTFDPRPLPPNVQFLPSNVQFLGVISDPHPPLKSDIINGRSLIIFLHPDALRSEFRGHEIGWYPFIFIIDLERKLRI